MKIFVSVFIFFLLLMFPLEIKAQNKDDINPNRVPHLFILKDTIYDGGRVYAFYEQTETATWGKKSFVVQFEEFEQIEKMLGALKFIWVYESPEDLTFYRWQEEFGIIKEKAKVPKE